MEVTRTIQIQITIIGEMDDDYRKISAEDVKQEIYDWLVDEDDADQVLVTVKDFIREEE